MAASTHGISRFYNLCQIILSPIWGFFNLGKTLSDFIDTESEKLYNIYTDVTSIHLPIRQVASTSMTGKGVSECQKDHQSLRRQDVKKS